MEDACEVVLSPAGLKSLNKGKKGKVNITKWKDNERRILRQAGKSYVTRKRQEKPAKQGPVLEKICKCQYKYGEINNALKENLFTNFYRLNHSEQNAVLVTCMQLCNIKRNITPENVREFKYFKEKIKNGVSTEDQRGKHLNRPHKIQDNLRNMVKEHIASFPTEESHYSRQKCAKMCLSSDLNIQKMFELFHEKYKEPKIKLHFYRDVFNEDLNLRFGIPRSDTCARCDLLYAKLVNAENEDERKNIKTESELHHRNAEQAYQTLKEDTERSKNDPSIVVICMDLQQVLFSPTLTHSNIFYQRQFSTYNFCIHNPATKDCVMHVWHETVAKRGSAEIASCLLIEDLPVLYTTSIPLKPGKKANIVDMCKYIEDEEARICFLTAA
ncbi:hypothetical protein NQ314_016357 [Rhamnusium bicolor]|uniref:Uncharacterized protein n=1 Tax=Rhamnusium bicolor TaxID=1586634 RepID=A0AAV8WX66_9CUCU|nr:hypothetical protein NQ314_016357 [Rhamnusium bicolor]